MLTLGPPEAAGQLRDMLALGAHHGVLLQTDRAEWGPVATATAIAETVAGRGYELLLFGNESADAGGYQKVGLRVPDSSRCCREVSADRPFVSARLCRQPMDRRSAWPDGSRCDHGYS